MKHETFDIWLLLQNDAGHNPELHYWLREWKVYGDVELDRRVPMALGIHEGQAYLRTPEPEKFVDDMVVRGEILAFSFAPQQELRALHGRIFEYRTRHVEAQWLGGDARLHHIYGPYYRHFVKFQFLMASPQASLDNLEGTEVSVGHVEKHHAPLILRPIRFTIEPSHEASFDLLCLNHGKPLHSLQDAVFLPPVRADIEEDSYFSLTRRALREQLHSLVARWTTSAIPAAVTLWRCLDEPLLRDLLLDGGSLHMVEDSVGATQIQLACFAKAEGKITAMDWLRKTLLLAPETVCLPEWARTLGHILVQDLQIAIGASCVLTEAAEPLSWRTPPSTRGDRSGSQTGTWQLLEALKEDMPDRKAAVDLHELVLWPTAPRFAAPPDHDQAEQLFCSHVCRCPWSDEGDPVWRQAILYLLDAVVARRASTPAALVASWQRPQLNLIATNASLTLVHPPSIDAATLRQWRLLLPLGTIFTCQSLFKLDSPTAKLDAGYVLA